MNTPEHAAASLEVRVRDALQPLGEVALQLDLLASKLRRAADAGDTTGVIDAGDQLLTAHVKFAQAFRLWLGNRPDRPAWRSHVVEAQAPSRLPAGSDAADSMST